MTCTRGAVKAHDVHTIIKGHISKTDFRKPLQEHAWAESLIRCHGVFSVSADAYLAVRFLRIRHPCRRACLHLREACHRVNGDCLYRSPGLGRPREHSNARLERASRRCPELAAYDGAHDILGGVT
jgi:hypothetical protein